MEKNKLRKVGLTALEWLKQHPEIKQHKESSLYEQLFASQQWQQAATSTNNRNDSVVTARIINTANFRAGHAREQASGGAANI